MSRKVDSLNTFYFYYIDMQSSEVTVLVNFYYFTLNYKLYMHVFTLYKLCICAYFLSCYF